MSWVVHVLGANNLRFSETDPDITPLVEVIARGEILTLLGSTNDSSFRHPATQSPMWTTSLRFDFFLCHTIEFRVSHYRRIGFNRKVGSACVSLATVEWNRPLTIPIFMDFHCCVQPTLSFAISPNWSPFPLISPKRSHKRIYVYTTCLPTISETHGTVPIGLKCITVDTVERRFSVLDETVDWETIGKGRSHEYFIGPSGPTQVVMLNRSKLKRAMTTFLICSGKYEGNVTLHFLLSEVGWHSGIYRKPPSRGSLGLLHEICVPVTPNSVCTIPYKLLIKKREIVFEPMMPIVFDPSISPPVFESDVARRMSNLACQRRLLQPRLFDRPIADMCDVHGIEIASSINVVFGWRPIQREKYQHNLSIAIEMYDANGGLVDTIAKSLFELIWKKDACGGSVVVEKTKAFAMDLPLFDSEFFEDHFNVKISLSELPSQVQSISFVAYDRISAELVHTYKRKFVRLIDSVSNTELELFHYRLDNSASKEACLIGGLYIGSRGWTFAPVVKLLNWESGFDHLHEEVQVLWARELEARGLINVI
jgi:hypothetical protein